MTVGTFDRNRARGEPVSKRTYNRYMNPESIRNLQLLMHVRAEYIRSL